MSYQQRSASKQVCETETLPEHWMCTCGSSPAYKMSLNEPSWSTFFIIPFHLLPGSNLSSPEPYTSTQGYMYYDKARSVPNQIRTDTVCLRTACRSFKTALESASQDSQYPAHFKWYHTAVSDGDPYMHHCRLKEHEGSAMYVVHRSEHMIPLEVI